MGGVSGVGELSGKTLGGLISVIFIASITLVRVESHQIITPFFERSGLFLVPVLHGLKGRPVAQGLLWGVLISVYFGSRAIQAR